MYERREFVARFRRGPLHNKLKVLRESEFYGPPRHWKVALPQDIVATLMEETITEVKQVEVGIYRLVPGSWTFLKETFGYCEYEYMGPEKYYRDPLGE